jgi:type IV pilus assembly protein PilN
MIRINLLPIRRRRAEETIRKEVSIFFLLILFSLAVMGYFHFGHTRDISRLSKEKTRLSQEIQRHQGRQKELKELENKKKILVQKLEIIDNLRTNRDLVVHVLDELANRVPADKMWFRRLTQQGNILTIEGVARGNETIAQFMQSLAQSPYIEANGVVLNQSRQEVIEEYKLKGFQLTCRIMAPKKPEQGEKQKEKKGKTKPASGNAA